MVNRFKKTKTNDRLIKEKWVYYDKNSFCKVLVLAQWRYCNVNAHLQYQVIKCIEEEKQNFEF